jgi:hemoglobin-like flavoprotein
MADTQVKQFTTSEVVDIVNKHYIEIESNLTKCIQEFRERLADPDNRTQWERAYEQGMARALLRIQILRDEMNGN